MKDFDGKANEYYNAGKYEQALKIYSAILPKTEEIMLTIATCWQNLNNIQEALKAYQEAFVLNPKNADTAYYIATIMIDNGISQTEGLSFLNKALEHYLEKVLK